MWQVHAQENRRLPGRITGQAEGKDGKEVTRVILLKNDAVTKAFHKKICGGDKIAVAVTGKFEGKGKERVIVASKIADPPPAKKGKGKKKA